MMIRQARIDVPLRTTCAYLYVDPHLVGSDPWWQRLFEHLTTLAPRDPVWHHEPLQNIFTLRPTLTDSQRLELMAFLRSAPIGERESHLTLRRAVNLIDEEARKLEVMFFSEGPLASAH